MWGYIGMMENKMETTIVYRGYIGIMENKMETTILYGVVILMGQRLRMSVFAG